jgi:CTP synthase
LVEIAEVKGHPYMVGSQFHPEFQSRPNHPHPLFDGFIRAAIHFHRARSPLEQMERAERESSMETPAQ